MGRFLIFFSYIGTKYRGLQVQNALIKGQSFPTIQGALHGTISKLQPSNEYKIILSSRTDLGVHALRNACHVDLKHPEEGKEYNPDVITSVLNYHLKLNNEEVRVLETKKVPDNFHSRLCAKGRKYVYRLAYLATVDTKQKEKFISELSEFRFLKNKRPCLPYGVETSIFEENRITFLWNQIDMQKLLLGAQVLSGIHDFQSFTTKRKITSGYQPHPLKLLTIGVKRGQPLGFPLMGHNFKGIENLEFWDIHVHARSFLYRQVRRVVGAMALLACNRITITDILDILDHPRKDFPFSGSMGMPDHGLYLKEVEYDPKDLICSGTSNSVLYDFDEHEDDSQEDHECSCQEKILLT